MVSVMFHLFAVYITYKQLVYWQKLLLRYVRIRNCYPIPNPNLKPNPNSNPNININPNSKSNPNSNDNLKTKKEYINQQMSAHFLLSYYLYGRYLT